MNDEIQRFDSWVVQRQRDRLRRLTQRRAQRLARHGLLFVLIVALLVRWMSAYAAAPFIVTQKGTWTTVCDGTVTLKPSLNQGEALEKSAGYAGNGHPDAVCIITPPGSEVAYSLVTVETPPDPVPTPTATLTWSAVANGTYAPLDGSTHPAPAAMNIRISSSDPALAPCTWFVNNTQHNTESQAPFDLDNDNTVTTYQAGTYAVRADCASGPIPASFTVANAVQPPPTKVSADLEWTPPLTDDAGKPQTVTGYRVVYGEQSNALTQSLNAPSALTPCRDPRSGTGNCARLTVPDLLTGRTWYFAVVTNTSAGPSPQSNPASKAL